MKNAFEEIWDLAEEYDVSLRTAAYMMSIKRVAIAMEKRGWYTKTPSESLANN